MLKNITKYLSVETLLHLVMVTFAVASVFNISTYMGASHNVIMSWCIGVSLGFGLVGLSIILSKVDTKKALFKKMLVATISVCLLSGTLQMLSYHAHGQPWVLAALFGYGFPIVAELILALAISAYDEDQKMKRLEEEENAKQMKLRNAKQGLKEKSALVIADTLDAYDPGEIQKFINKEINLIVKTQVSEVLAELLPTPVNKISAKDNENADYPSLPTSNNENDADWMTQRDIINAGRKGKKQEELKRFADFLAQHYAGCRTVELNYTQIEKEFGKSARTIKRYIQELQQADIINGYVDASLIAQM